MFYDPDAPQVPGQPDYSKGCMPDLPDDMRPQHQQPAPPTTNPAPLASTSSSSSSSSASSSESDSTAHSPHRTFRHGAAAASVPSHVDMDAMAAFYPAAAASPSSCFSASSSASLLSPSTSPAGSSSGSLLTALSPYLSVLYALLAAVLLLSFYLIPHSRPRRRQKPTVTDKQQAIERILTAAKQQATAAQQQQQQQQQMTATNGTPPLLPHSLSPFLPSSPLTARYLHNASLLPSSLSSHFTPLELSHAIRLIVAGFDEDVGSGDISTLATIPATSSSSARFLAKESGTISGLHIVELVFQLYDPQLSTTWSVVEGATVKAGTVIGVVTGPSQSLLTSERLALNLLQRMSGIATHTAGLRGLIEAVSSPTLLLDTRKTAAGMRMLDKMAVRAGGAVNHRIGLYDMVMIKDNHITAAGGISQAIDQVQQWCTQQQRTVPIEVETRSMDEVRQLLAYLKTTAEQQQQRATVPVTRIMLDNMVRVKRDEASGEVTDVDVSMLQEAVQLLKSDEYGRKLESEASGNVTAETIARIAETHVTFISVGAVTHSVRALDVSLKITV